MTFQADRFKQILEENPKLQKMIIEKLKVPLIAKGRKRNLQSIQRSLRHWKRGDHAPDSENQRVLRDAMLAGGIAPSDVDECGFDFDAPDSLASQAHQLGWTDRVSELEIHCLINGIAYAEARHYTNGVNSLRLEFLQRYLYRLNRIYPGTQSYAETRYVDRGIDQRLTGHVASQSNRNLLLIVNFSGAGKTTSLLHHANQLWLQGNPTLFLSGADFSGSASGPSAETAQEFLRKAMQWEGAPIAESTESLGDSKWQAAMSSLSHTPHWEALNEALRAENKSLAEQGLKRRRKLVIIWDAIDRFNGPLEQLPDCVTRVLEFLVRFDQFKIIVSCRREVWANLGLASHLIQHPQIADRIVNGQPEKQLEFKRFGSWRMEDDASDSGYTRDRFQAAIDAHCQWFQVQIAPGTEGYSEAFFETARNPLFLRLFFEAHRGQTISLKRPPKIWNTYFRFMGKKRNSIRRALIEKLGLGLQGQPLVKAAFDELLSRFILQCAVYLFCQKKTEMPRSELQQHLEHWWTQCQNEQSKLELRQHPTNRDPKEWDLEELLRQSLPSDLPSAILEYDSQKFVSRLLDEAGASGLLNTAGNSVRFDFDWYYEFCFGRAIGNACLENGEQIFAVVNGLEHSYRRDSRSVMEALKLAIVHCEFASESSTYLQILSVMAGGSYEFQQTACLAIRSLGLVAESVDTETVQDSLELANDDIISYSPRFSKFSALKNGTLAKRRELAKRIKNDVNAILVDCVNAIAIKSDFVCRFDLRDAIHAVRRSHPEPTNGLLQRWYSPEDYLNQPRLTKSDFGRLMLQMIVAIDVLGYGDQHDLAPLIRILTQSYSFDCEFQFWSRRFAAVAINQIVENFPEHVEEEALTVGIKSIFAAYHELLDSPLNSVEEAMLHEQFVLFVALCPAKIGRVQRWELLDSRNIGSPWAGIARQLATLNINNRWMRAGRLPADHGEFLRWVSRSVIGAPSAETTTSAAEEVTRGVFLRAIQQMLSHPEQVIEEDEMQYGVTKLATWDKTATLAIGFSPEFLTVYHQNHHECRERMYGVIDRLFAATRTPAHPLFQSRFFEPALADIADLRGAGHPKPIHADEYIARVQEACAANAHSKTKIEVEVRPGSWGAAMRSAGCLKAAVDFSEKTLEQVAICINRPPGHLAENQICIFNNIAVGVRYAQERRLKKGMSAKVLVIDLDAHHGKHIQRTFYDDPDVTFVSIHQDNVHPGSGFVEEIGRTRLRDPSARKSGLGTTVNIPIPPFSDSADYIDVLHSELREVIQIRKPDLIFVALGVDGESREPFASLEFTPSCYFQAGRVIREHRGKNTPVISSFEGGFAVCSGAIADCVEAFAIGVASDSELPPHLQAFDLPDSSTGHELKKPASPFRSIVCRRFHETPSQLIASGSVDSVLACRCQADELQQLGKNAPIKMEFGVGAGSGLADPGAANGDLGEVVLVGSRYFHQRPSTQEVVSSESIWSPFFFGWSGVPNLWMHIRLREGVFLNRIVQLLDQAMNIDCDLLGMAGFFKVERLVEKRLSRSPERGAAAMLNDGKSDIPLLLRPENFPTFFTSQLPAIPTLSPYVATCGLVYRNQTGTPRAKQLERLFYRSPLSAGSGTHIQYHVHGLLLPDEGLEGCPDEHELSRIGGQGKGLMATHLEDQTLISECQIGIYCLKLDK